MVTKEDRDIMDFLHSVNVADFLIYHIYVEKSLRNLCFLSFLGHVYWYIAIDILKREIPKKNPINNFSFNNLKVHETSRVGTKYPTLLLFYNSWQSNGSLSLIDGYM